MKSAKGFTLVEMVIVVLIIGALAAIAIPRIGTSAATAKARACNTNIQIINRQIELYKANTGSWPSSLTDVTENPDYFPDGEPACSYGTAYSLDQATHRIAGHSHSDSGASTQSSPEVAVPASGGAAAASGSDKSNNGNPNAPGQQKKNK